MQTLTNFYQSIFASTGGFVPNWPLGTEVQLGDLFTIQQGRFNFVGNLQELKLKQPMLVSGQLNPTPQYWQVQSGTDLAYQAKGVGKLGKHQPAESIAKNRLKIRFKERGDFFFQACAPSYRRISNLHVINRSIISQLAAYKFGFKSIYVVTDLATAHGFEAAVGQRKSSIEFASDQAIPNNVFGLMEKDLALEVYASKRLEFYTKIEATTACFFRAQKLTLRQWAIDKLIDQLVNTPKDTILLKGRDAKGFMEQENLGALQDNHNPYLANLIDNDLTDLIRPVELTGSSAAEMFEFSDWSLSDVQLFLGTNFR